VSQWREVFNGMFGMRAVLVELGSGIELRVTTTDRKTGHPVTVQKPNPAELKRSLIEENIFTAEEIEEMIRKIMYR